MKFLTYQLKNELKVGVLGANDEIIELDFKDMNELILSFDFQKLSQIASKNGSIKLDEIIFKAPIINPLQDVICLGLNYLDHAIESAKFKGIKTAIKTDEAVYFSKRVNYAMGHNEAIFSHSKITSKLDYEVELGVIIQKDAKNVKKEDANDYIFGYTIINDISAREIQTKHKQWYFGKSLDESLPMGPFIVTKDEFELPLNLAVKSFVNGELRQNSSTKHFIFNVPHVIEELSLGMTLKAGSIISMGTPSGVGMGFEPPKFLKSGDEVVCEIEKIGKLKSIIK